MSTPTWVGMSIVIIIFTFGILPSIFGVVMLNPFGLEEIITALVYSVTISAASVLYLYPAVYRLINDSLPVWTPQNLLWKLLTALGAFIMALVAMWGLVNQFLENISKIPFIGQDEEVSDELDEITEIPLI